MLIFLLQGAVIASLGAILGNVAGHGLLTMMSQIELPQEQEAFVRTDRMVVSDDPVMYVYGFLFALAAGVTASLLPALRASKIEPVDVLRGHVG